MKKRNIAIQVIRILAMFMIVICHILNASSNNMLNSLSHFFDVGVFLFLLISGYLYGTKKIDNKIKWLKSRWLSLLVPVYIFVFIVIGMNYRINGDFNILKILGYIFNIQYFSGSIRGLGHLWFLTIIMICYIILILKKDIRTFKYNFTLLIVGIVSGFYLKNISLLLFYILSFNLGSYLSNNKNVIEKLTFIKCIFICVFGIGIRVLGKIYFDNTLFYETIITAVTHIMLSVGIFIFVINVFKRYKHDNKVIKSIVNYFDCINYYVYIVHYILIVGPISVMNITKNFVINTIIMLVLTFAFAHVLKIITECFMKVRVVKINFNELMRCLMIFFIAGYKFLLSIGIRNLILLISIVMVSGIICIYLILKNIKKYKKRDVIIFFVLCCISFITLIKLKSPNFVFPLMIALAFYDENPKKIAKYFFYALTVGMLIILSLNCYGILENYDVSGLIFGISFKRYGLGFSNTAFVMLYYIGVLISYYYAFGINSKSLYVLNFFGIFLYLLSNSRTGIICLIAFNLLILIVNIKYIKKFLSFVLPYIYPIMTFLMIFIIQLSYRYDLKILDKLLSDRLFFNRVLLESNSFFTFLGIGKDINVPLDNYYLYYIIILGILGFIVFIILNFLSLKNLKNLTDLIICQLIIFAYGIGDSNVVVSSINFMLSIQALVLINRDNRYLQEGEKYYEE